MSKAIVVDNSMKKSGDLALPETFKEINSQNLYLYVKSYQASLRANGAKTKTRAEVKGGGKKPWSQKGGGRARAGSITSPVFVGGGIAHAPRGNRNYDQKVNKKQKLLALKFALNTKAESGALFVTDSIKVESGKTKDAAAALATLNVKSCLIVCNEMDEKTFMAFRNLSNCYLAGANELNAYTATAFDAVLIEKSVLEAITKEG